MFGLALSVPLTPTATLRFVRPDGAGQPGVAPPDSTPGRSAVSWRREDATMRFWVGVTDPSWFAFHRARGSGEVNFWQPSSRPPFTKLPEGTPFLFKLKGAANAIAGGGYYVTTSTLPLEVAWEVFGPQNGAASLHGFRSMIDPKGLSRAGPREYVCQLVVDAVFLPEDRWLRAPPGFAKNLVQGRSYDAAEPEGAAILAHVSPWLYGPRPSDLPAAADTGETKWAEPVLVKPRLGQSGFRVRLFEAYERRCAMTGESTLPTLDAAHIVPYAEAGSDHEITNGLLLRTDFHRLFDNGLVTVEPDLTIRVSPRIREAWYNGKAYYRLDGTRLAVVPQRREWRPDPDRLHWHNTHVFQRA
jgi:putative restriction endonuclease